MRCFRISPSSSKVKSDREPIDGGFKRIGVNLSSSMRFVLTGFLNGEMTGGRRSGLEGRGTVVGAGFDTIFLGFSSDSESVEIDIESDSHKSDIIEM